MLVVALLGLKVQEIPLEKRFLMNIPINIALERSLFRSFIHLYKSRIITLLKRYLREVNL